jgi:UDPglucose--hexose-1-phosphate uridylyltransferase
MKNISELRQDLVSGDWVVIATGRAKRPHDFSREKRPIFVQPKSSCPFEALHKNALVLYSLDGERQKENWWVEVIPNKFPAFGSGKCQVTRPKGPYQWSDGVGFHEVVVTRDHTRSLALMTDEEAELVVRSYQDRFLALRDEKCVKYISVFHNHGAAAGASVSHPHSQIIALPVIPPDISKSIEGSARYFLKNKACAHCTLLKYELRAKDRVVFENKGYVVLAPFASKTAFELRIYPKRHAAHFADMDASERLLFANALRTALAKQSSGLKNPDYNFFLHTAPVGDVKKYNHYHWHFEILPKTAIWAGFEIGTGIEISTIAPESAAKFLKSIKVK